MKIKTEIFRETCLKIMQGLLASGDYKENYSLKEEYLKKDIIAEAMSLTASFLEEMNRQSCEGYIET